VGPAKGARAFSRKTVVEHDVTLLAKTPKGLLVTGGKHWFLADRKQIVRQPKIETAVPHEVGASARAASFVRVSVPKQHETLSAEPPFPLLLIVFSIG